MSHIHLECPQKLQRDVPQQGGIYQSLTNWRHMPVLSIILSGNCNCSQTKQTCAITVCFCDEWLSPINARCEWPNQIWWFSRNTLWWQCLLLLLLPHFNAFSVTWSTYSSINNSLTLLIAHHNLIISSKKNVKARISRLTLSNYVWCAPKMMVNSNIEGKASYCDEWTVPHTRMDMPWGHSSCLEGQPHLFARQ